MPAIFVRRMAPQGPVGPLPGHFHQLQAGVRSRLVAEREYAELVAWICFGVGLVVLGVGLLIGLRTSLSKQPSNPSGKLEEAKQKIVEAKTQIQTVSSGAALEAGGVGAAAGTAAESAEAAKSALEQVEGIVASLPENLRFSGMLVLVGAVLISVGTIQFGGVSLF